MKKLNFALLLAFALSAVLISCGGGGGGGGGTAPATTTETTNTASTPATTTTTTTTTTSSTTPTPAPTPTLTAPTIQQVPTGKVLVSGSKIGITTSVAGATIYYTLDGTDPTSSSSVYTASKVTINSSCTLKAMIMKDTEFSTVASCTYSVVQRKATPNVVNDIVFKDGTAIAYSTDLYFTDEVKADAVAMIFYKGTECSNDGSTRTLGVGLKRSPSYTLKWCLETANGYNTNITTIQCTPSESAGAYTFTGVKDGSDNLSQIAAFLAGNNDTGTAANYPAFYWAKNYGTTNGCTGAYANGWYLPSIAELYQIYNLRTNIDAALALCGLTSLDHIFSRGYFWSSSQYASGGDFVHVLWGGKINSWDYKYRPCYNYAVCAVRAF